MLRILESTEIRVPLLPHLTRFIDSHPTVFLPDPMPQLNFFVYQSCLCSQVGLSSEPLLLTPCLLLTRPILTSPLFCPPEPRSTLAPCPAIVGLDLLHLSEIISHSDARTTARASSLLLTWSFLVIKMCMSHLVQSPTLAFSGYLSSTFVDPQLPYTRVYGTDTPLTNICKPGHYSVHLIIIQICSLYVHVLVCVEDT